MMKKDDKKQIDKIANEQQEIELIADKMKKGEYRVFANVEELIKHLENIE